MTYVHVTTTPGTSLETYFEVTQALGPDPVAGLVSRYAGNVDGTLVVVNVYESQAHADRFAAERLFPAFEQVGVPAPPDGIVLAFVPVESVVA